MCILWALDLCYAFGIGLATGVRMVGGSMPQTMNRIGGSIKYESNDIETDEQGILDGTEAQGTA